VHARSRRWLRGLALSGLTLVATVLALELGLRLTLGPVRPGNVTSVPKALIQDSDFPGLRYVLRPDAEGVQEFGSDPRGYFDPGARLTYRVNSLGFRGPETTRAKPAGVFRIVALGDSILFGTGVRDEDLLASVLQRRLEADGRRCEVLNLGVFGYDTFEESILFRRLGLGLDPDLALFVFVLNDTNAVGGRAFEAFNETGERSPLRRASVLWDHLAARLSRRSALAQLVADYERGFADGAPGWIRAREALEKAQEAAEKRDVPVVLVLFPLLWELDEHHPFASIHARVAATARSLGFHVLDLLPAFLGQDGPALWVHPSNQHPNERAHALAAQAIERFLSDEALLEPHGR
jgi:lysophospholipase L1-like esterase